jgi:murein DD-endopeptidase MepM/ murein hydrolase activator NlpD
MRKFLAVLLTLCMISAPLSAALAQEGGGPTYIVQPGDTLSSIAARFDISLDELMNANDIGDPNLVGVGQELVIPGLEGVSGVLDTEVINFGDSYRSLVRRTQIDPALFEKLNHLTSPTEFFVGASMILPTQSDAPSYAGMSLAAGQSLLEMAVIHDTDVWTVSTLNQLGGSWDGLPGDTLYAPGEPSSQGASGLPPAFLSAEIKGLPLKQGGTAIVLIKTEPGVSLSGILVDHQLNFFPLDDGQQVALQGVHALLEPGVYPLRLEAALPDGSKQSFEQSLLVVSGNYLEDPLLYVDPSTIDPVATEPEQAQLIELVKEADPQRYWTGAFTSPAIQYPESPYYTSRFGNRRTYIGQGTEVKVNTFHTGLDYGGGIGLPISAPAAGRVVFAAPLTVRGNATIINHGWGVYSGFWHQSEFKVQVGDMVQPGQVIGIVGGTGRVTGAHLHWELWVNGVQVDPLDWLNETYP